MKFDPEKAMKLDIHRLDFMAEDTTTGVIQAWHRAGVNESLPDKDGFISVDDSYEQLEIPFDP